MKNFVLVVISAIVLTVFIAFNYLLWDRESRIKSFENLKDSQNVSIDSLKQQLDEASKENKNLKDKNNELSQNLKYFEDDNTELSGEKEGLKNKLQQANDLVTDLESKIDIKPVEMTVKKWVDSINSQHLDTAYNMRYKNIFSTPGAISMDAFKNVYSKGITSIRVKSVRPYTERAPEEMSGQALFIVSLDVKKENGSGSGFFDEGMNDKIFVLQFDKQNNEWDIVDILGSV